MYKCECCGKLSKPGMRAHVVPVKLRRTVYEGRGQRTEGHEIEREMCVCKTCAPEVDAMFAYGEPKLINAEGAFTKRTSYHWLEENSIDVEENVPPGMEDRWTDEDWVYDSRYDTYIRVIPEDANER